MKLDQLRYFLEAARLEHIGQAAQSLHITPSAISHSIQGLEEELGCSLFIKKGKHIFLTAEGKKLKEKAEHLLAEADLVKKSLTSDDKGLSGHFRLAGSHGLCSLLLTPVWAKLAAEHPGLSAEIYSLRSAEVLSRIGARQLELGICFSPQDQPDVESEVIYQGQLLVVVKKNHPVLKKKKDIWAELSKYPAILPKAYQGIEVCEHHPVFKDVGLKLNPVVTFDSYETGISAVENSEGWSFIPDWWAHSKKKTLEVIPFGKDLKAPYTVAVVWPRKVPHAPAIEMLMSRLKEAL